MTAGSIDHPAGHARHGREPVVAPRPPPVPQQARTRRRAPPRPTSSSAARERELRPRPADGRRGGRRRATAGTARPASPRSYRGAARCAPAREPAGHSGPHRSPVGDRDRTSSSAATRCWRSSSRACGSQRSTSSDPARRRVPPLDPDELARRRGPPATSGARRGGRRGAAPLSAMRIVSTRNGMSSVTTDSTECSDCHPSWLAGPG